MAIQNERAVRFLFLAGTLAGSMLFGNGCLLGGSGECDTEGVPPVNVTATGGDGSVALSWEIPAFDTNELEAIQTMVLYPAMGGTGEQCATADINHTPEGCVRACQSANATPCTVTGLTNGVSYTFTVITTAYPHNLYRCVANAFVRSDPVTPTIGPPSSP